VKHVIALGLALVLNAGANLMMKAGMTRVEASGGLLKDGPAGGVGTILASPILLAGLLCFALNAFCYMYALQSKALKISLAYPIMVGGGYAIIALAAFFLLNERLATWQWIGVALILAGVMIVAMNTEPDAAPSSPA
jgi:small multidrug resistance pump